MSYRFEQVNGSKEQIRGLYWLLQKRVHTISHEILQIMNFMPISLKTTPIFIGL